MSIIMLCPKKCGTAYETAADAFKKMYRLTTGNEINASEEDDGKSDLVIIGSDAVNDFLLNEMLDRNVPDLGIRYGTDDYRCKTYRKGTRRVLILAGGRARSTIYAVYGYYEKYMGCRYFWDGDVIPNSGEIVLEGVDDCESPRFSYRGIRYFAHRGLKRFQAEHWSLRDWQTEIDFLMKKRLNLFMLRIGMDDVWQKTFPDEVPYPETYRVITDEKGYDDRSDFWSLRYRGTLRKKIMEYAERNDLMSMTDTGTMTHWYSRTPKEFLLSRKPVFLEQADRQYNTYATGRVFDFRVRENMDAYMQLTKTMAEVYDGNTFLFHTIGLGERRMYEEDRRNFMLKKLCYRRIAETLRRVYPHSLLMLATWDFVGWWRPEEVREFIAELDPERTILLDYTSDGRDEKQSFVNWGIVNRFPWIFGLFHAYEAESELRGDYDRTEERLKIAAEDPMCRGMVLWPELSHSDPLVLEYLCTNAWHPLEQSVEQMTACYSYGRYGVFGERMNRCWQSFLPFLKLSGWGGYTAVNKPNERFATDNYWFTHSDIFTKPVYFVIGSDSQQKPVLEYYEKAVKKAKQQIESLSEVLNSLAAINAETEDKFIRRDTIDIARTVCGRFLNYLLAKAFFRFGMPAETEEIRIVYQRLTALLSELLRHTKDFSVYETLLQLRETAPVNPDFERTLKENILNNYCRQYAVELIDSVFQKEGEAVFDWLQKPYEQAELRRISADICREFMQTPLSDMQKKAENSLPEVLRRIVTEIEKAQKIL